ncbi:MAG: hypothetical protein K6E34_05775 [Lachnospiraceae bacterium]|nr:hypothetical protein [Lachnospiraceae bacterium]
MIDYNTRLLYLMKAVGALSMRYRFRMKDSVDGDILQRAVQSAMQRYPYLKKRIRVNNGTFVLEDNPLPVPVMKTSYPMPSFGSDEMNGHLLCVDYEDDCIYFTLLHNLGGGRGLLRWCLTVLYQYVMDRYGEEPGWEGVRKPYKPCMPGEELIQPFDKIPDDTPVLWPGFSPEIKPILPSVLENGLKGSGEEGFFRTTITLKEDRVIERVKACKASPAVWFAVIYYRAVVSCLKDVPEYIDMGIACDVSDRYGISESMSLVTKFLHFVISKEDRELDTEALCSKGRSMIKEQRDPGATDRLLKKERDTLTEMDKLPTLEEKIQFYFKNSMIADMVPSALVSYVGKLDVPGIERYVEDLILDSVSNRSGTVIFAQNGRFSVSVLHGDENSPVIDAYIRELEKEGLNVEAIEKNRKQNNIGVVFP